MRYKDGQAMFISQCEQAKEQQELAMAEAKQSRSKSEIQKYVDRKFKVDGGFAFGPLIFVVNVILERIRSFNK
jgi:hypothetical protein